MAAPHQLRRPLWTCPRCGHRFVTRNLWHSCGRHRLADHFAGKPRHIRRLFDRFCALARAGGPVTIYAQKSRIVCQARVRFGGAVPRARWLEVALWLKRRVSHPRLRRIESFGRLGYGHHFRFTRTVELDRAFATLVREAYAVGRQVSTDS